MATDHQEVEWQFDALDLDTVEQWLIAQSSTAGEVEIGSESAKDQVDTYFDTSDWRFFRAGYALRVRRKGDAAEITMKSLDDSGTGARRRREINEDIPAAGTKETATALLRRAQGDVGRRVRAISGPHVASIRPLFETRTHRRTLSLSIDGRLAAEIALDDTVIPASGRSKGVQLRRVEVEVNGDSTAAVTVKAFIKRMRKACQLRRATRSKYQTGLEARGLVPTSMPDLGPTDVEASAPVGELTFAVMRKQLAAILAHEPGARLGDDIKEIHAMRVAVRRMRAAMNLFKDFLPEELAAFRTELDWLGDALGEVRDLDVQLEQVNAWRDAAGADGMTADSQERTGQQTVADILCDQRHQAHERLLVVLNARRYERLTAGLAVLLRNPPQEPDSAQKSAAAVASELIPRAYRKMRKLGDRLNKHSSIVDYHKVRIKCKQLRYGLEFVMDLYGKPATTLLKRAVALQDTIGAYHDSQVAMDKFRDMSANSQHDFPPQAVLALDETAVHYEQQGAHAKANFPRVYARLKGKPWKRLEKVIKAQSKRS